MSASPPPQVVQLTPPGRGAIATILVQGRGAIEAVGRRFRLRNGQPLESLDDRRLALGTFGEETVEEVVLRRRSDQSVEIHCHGGRAAVSRIKESLAAMGCSTIGWQEWVEQRHEDPITAAAHRALADAPTQRTAAILLDQYNGALSRELDRIEGDLREGDHAAAKARIDTLLGRVDVGRHLVRPWRVVLLGRPNVGKSSLINAIVGYRRAIVHPTPGTTRDVVTAGTAVDGWPVELSDTAGLHAADDPTERAGIERAREQLAEADLLLAVFDASTPWSEADDRLLASLAPAKVLAVHNKVDLSRAGDLRPEGLWVSASTGQAVEELIREIAGHLVPNPPPPGSAVPFAEDQVRQIQRLAARSVS